MFVEIIVFFGPTAAWLEFVGMYSSGPGRTSLFWGDLPPRLRGSDFSSGPRVLKGKGGGGQGNGREGWLR